MSDLTAKQLHKLGESLGRRADELRSEVLSAREAAADSAIDLSTEVDDQVAAGEERFRSGIEHAQLQRDQEELQEIEGARERLAADAYGDCIDCGLPIPFERLLAQPAALRCIPCQSKWEKSHQAAPRYMG